MLDFGEDEFCSILLALEKRVLFVKRKKEEKKKNNCFGIGIHTCKGLSLSALGRFYLGREVHLLLPLRSSLPSYCCSLPLQQIAAITSSSSHALRLHFHSRNESLFPFRAPWRRSPPRQSLSTDPRYSLKGEKKQKKEKHQSAASFSFSPLFPTARLDAHRGWKGKSIFPSASAPSDLSALSTLLPET